MHNELVKRCKALTDYNGLIPDEMIQEAFDCVKEAADAIEELQADNTALNGTVSNLIQQIAELSKPRWIPVTERLPETGVDVLVMFPHNMAVASRDMGEWVVNSGDGWCTGVNLSDDEKEPTHWMPLPEPPKDGES